MLSQSIQDYLKSIYKLQDNGMVSTTDLAKELEVTGASVTGMLKRLSTMGMVDYNSYKGVKLTDAGEKIALEIVRHHRLLELYLKEMLDYPLEKVHDEACRLEHHISDDFLDKINDLLGNPQFDPHGHPIPSEKGEMRKTSGLMLSDVEQGSKVQISSLDDSDEKLLGYLEELGLVPNTHLEVIEIGPFNGPIKLNVNGTEHIIGHEVAGCIYVESTQ